MNIVVLGAGAVGGYFGGRLALSGANVTFLVRAGRARQLAEHGLRVKSVHGDFSIQPQLSLSVADIAHPDVVIVAVKNYHLDDAWNEIQTLVHNGAKVLPLMNGVQHIDNLVQAFGEEAVFGGVCYIEATLDSDGQVIHTSPMHDIVFGPLKASDDPLAGELERLIADSGINVQLSESVMVDMWKKFIFLTSFSGMTAAVRKPIGDILADAAASERMYELVRELTRVASAKQPDLPSELMQQTIAQLQRISPKMTSSLHRDLEKGLPLEIDSLQGAVLEMAETYELDTPVVRTIYALLHPYKNGAEH